MSTTNDFIRANYQDLTDIELGEKLDPPLSEEAVRSRRRRMNLNKEEYNKKTQKILNQLGLHIEDVGAVEKVTVNNRSSTTKKDGEEDQTNTIHSTSVVLSPTWEDGPEWDPVSQAPPVIIKPTKAKAPNRDFKLAIALPDPQIGYRRNKDGELTSMHDEEALNLSLQIIQEYQPDLIINLGDLMDFAEFGSFAKEPNFVHSVQPAIDRASSFLAEQRASAPDAEIVVIAGNHDERLQKFVIKNALAAFGLTRANSEDEWPVLSLPFLLRLEDFDVEYVEGYPTGEYYINDRLKCIHGKRTGQRGSIAKKIAGDESVSTITGHNHHVEMITETVVVNDEPVIKYAATLGCLCAVDGRVPSYHSAIDARGEPTRYWENWQQAVGIIRYEEGNGHHDVTPVMLDQGKAVVEGKLFEANI